MNLLQKWLEKDFGPNTYFSFILDPVLLILFGITIVWLTVRKFYKRYGRKKVILLGLALTVLISFWLIAGVGFYLDNLNIPFLGEAGRGNHFMWNSYCELLGIEPFVDTTVPTYANFLSPLNLLALFIFIILYPAFLYIGIQFGFILFGRNEKQTGFIEFFKP